MRKITDVMDQIILLIPNDPEEAPIKSKLIEKFAPIYKSAPHFPPELKSPRLWNDLFYALHGTLGDRPTKQYQWEIASLVTTKPIAVLRRELDKYLLTK